MQMPLTLPGPPEGVRAALSVLSVLESALDRAWRPLLPFAGFLANVWVAYTLVLLLPVAMMIMYFSFGRRPMLRDASVFFSASTEIILLSALLTGEWRGAEVDLRFLLPALGLMLVLMTWASARLLRVKTA